MRTESFVIEDTYPDSVNQPDSQLVFNFSVDVSSERLEWLKSSYPKAEIISCQVPSAFNELSFVEKGAVINAVNFMHSEAKVVFYSAPIGLLQERLSKELPFEGLRHVLVFAGATTYVGEEFLDILHDYLPKGVSATGGFTGGELKENSKAGAYLIGLYGDKLSISHGWGSGWRPFGGSKQVTGVEGNQIFELDHRPALELYASYLGEYTESLPESSFLFPFGLEHGNDYLLRCALDVDRERSSLVFGANIPRGSKLRMMTARHTDLVDAAQTASGEVLSTNEFEDSLLLVFSSLARKLLMGTRAPDELDVIREVHPMSRYSIGGFYSYAEASPLIGSSVSLFHNQSVGITRLEEQC